MTMELIFSKNNWLFRYKLHHLLFWAVYHFVWWVVYEGSAERMIGYLLYAPIAIKYLFYVVFQAVGVYFCLYYLVPTFLKKGRYAVFLSYLALTIIAIALCIYSGYFLAAYVGNTDVRVLFNLGDQPVFNLFKSNALPSSIASMTLGMSIKLAKNYYEGQLREQELKQEKLETELKFLKSQFNPHFLFNTINTIFVLIHKNTNLASESLAKFSSLLRYQLYECNEPQIPLNREIAYLEGFIELEKLRLNDNYELKVDLPLNYTGSLSIAPFLLMPFVENAFKHVSQKKKHINWIKVHLYLENKELIFEVSNSYCKETQQANLAIDYGGLGLKNVRRRLDLLYPGSHRLAILENEGVFTVQLKIELKEQLEPSIVLIDS